MSQRTSLILGILILSIAGTYFWWRSEPEQEVNRQVDLFIESVAFKKLSLKTSESRAEACQLLFADEVEVIVPEFSSPRVFTKDELVNELKRFHHSITLFQITESSREVSVENTHGTAHINAEMRVAAGPNWKQALSGAMTLTFTKEDTWKISQIEVIED